MGGPFMPKIAAKGGPFMRTEGDRLCVENWRFSQVDITAQGSSGHGSAQVSVECRRAGAGPGRP
jgi:hypothetical protein